MLVIVHRGTASPACEFAATTLKANTQTMRLCVGRRHAGDTRQLNRHVGGGFGVLGSPTGILPARFGAKNAVWAAGWSGHLVDY
jgi:hypothetical protein